MDDALNNGPMDPQDGQLRLTPVRVAGMTIRKSPPGFGTSITNSATALEG